MAMTVEELATTLRFMIENDKVDPDEEIRVLLPQVRTDASYNIDVVIDDIEVPHLEINTDSFEYFSKFN